MLEHLANHYKNRLLQETDFEKLQNLSEWDMRLSITNLIERFIHEERVILSRSDQAHLLARILDDSVGMGPLETYLHDDDITEVMVNGPFEIFIERNGLLERTDGRFRDESHLRHIIDRIVAPIGRRIDESSPMVDARLRDGSRVHAVLPPVSLKGPILTIRKFRKRPFTIDDLLENQTITPGMAGFLAAAVRSKLNILVSGGTGSGKTTLLNVLSSFIPAGERLITIEDSAELRLQGQHVVALETKPMNVEGHGEITIRELVRNALRMRPDRIIVGEVRGSEAFDMLQAMNTGHEGALVTVHANSPYDALARLESMLLIGAISLPVSVIRQYILSAIDLIVHTQRLSDGKRKVLSIAEVIQNEGQVSVNELFVWQKNGVSPDGQVLGEFKRNQTEPACLQRIKNNGFTLDQIWEGAIC